jgi:hypothetical protein
MSGGGLSRSPGLFLAVIPAQAGIQEIEVGVPWIPERYASGMTIYRVVRS